MIVKLLTEHNLEFLSLKGGCRGLLKSTHVKMPHCWKYHATAHLEIAACVPLLWSHSEAISQAITSLYAIMHLIMQSSSFLKEKRMKAPKFATGLNIIHSLLLLAIRVSDTYLVLKRNRDENSQHFSIRKICQLTPKWRKAIFKSLIKDLKSQNINRNKSV